MKKSLSIAYFGSSNFSANFLEKLLTTHSSLVTINFVVTQPDRKVGRKQILTATPVKQIASKYQVPTFEVGDWKLGLETGYENRNKKIEKNPTSIFQDTDIALVYAYANIIPKSLLNLPTYGFWSIHPSLLPKYRGPSPMATALINGDAETGVTIFKMDEKVDHGPIICQEKYRILLTDKRPDLEIKLTDIAFKIFKKMIRNVILSEERSDESKDPLTIKLTPQNHSLATYTKKLLKQDGFIPFENLKLALSEVEGLKIYNLYRGLYPWPGLWTLIQPARPTRSNAAGQKRLKITDLDFIDERLIIKKVKLEGKKEVDFKTFNQAYQIF